MNKHINTVKCFTVLSLNKNKNQILTYAKLIQFKMKTCTYLLFQFLKYL